ncbi:uncharacterized protein IL334_002959 [Kwoniella shivajii]|uniref:DNA polymerase delta subunit 3 n=1 Tax=Kwoniella shivajii TaxID=564305 RepID=A0ABZ1CW63_9TREE|nr:hypothetical protein IL334_002959 [Kwoniella shivajii]
MATSEQQKIANRKLSQWIENDRRIVTYRDISREIGCHVNIAKNLLSEYSQSHSEVIPTFLLTGPLLSESKLSYTQLPSLTQSYIPTSRIVKIVDMDEMSEGDRNSEDDDGRDRMDIGNDKGDDENGISGGIILGGSGGKIQDDLIKKEDVDRWGVVLVSIENLEEKKHLFQQDKLNIHIHSLSPSPITDPAQYLIPNLTLRQHQNYHNPDVYGTITGEAFKPSIVVQEKKVMKDGGIDWSKKVVAGKKVEANKVEEPIKKKDESKKSTDPKQKENEKQEIDKVEDKPKRPSSSSIATSSKPTPAPASAPSASASGSMSKKKRVIQSDTEEDEPAPQKTKDKEQTSSMVRMDDQKAMEAMMSMDMDMDVDLGVSDSEQVKTEPGAHIGNKVRKKRRVKKSKTETDKRGRMVVKDYSTDESYTASENDETPTATKQRSTKPTTTTTTTAKPPIKARESTSSVGSDRGKTPASSASASASHPAKKPAGPARGQSTLKGFFTKK